MEQQKWEIKKKLQVERLTPQRVLLFNIVKECPTHLHVSELYKLARKKDPTINLATVYRTLKEFKKTGIVEELHLEEEHHHYENAEKHMHHHLICEKCGTISDFTTEETGRMSNHVKQKYSFFAKKVQIHIRGICKKCYRNTNSK